MRCQTRNSTFAVAVCALAGSATRTVSSPARDTMNQRAVVESMFDYGPGTTAKATARW